MEVDNLGMDDRSIFLEKLPRSMYRTPQSRLKVIEPLTGRSKWSEMFHGLRRSIQALEAKTKVGRIRGRCDAADTTRWSTRSMRLGNVVEFKSCDKGR